MVEEFNRTQLALITRKPNPVLSLKLRPDGKPHDGLSIM